MFEVYRIRTLLPLGTFVIAGRQLHPQSIDDHLRGPGTVPSVRTTTVRRQPHGLHYGQLNKWTIGNKERRAQNKIKTEYSTPGTASGELEFIMIIHFRQREYYWWPGSRLRI